MAIDTDLAVEAYNDAAKIRQLEGVDIVERFDERSEFKITEIEIFTDLAAERLGRRKGKYITLESKTPLYEYSPLFAERCAVLSEELAKVCADDGQVLFVGLGNRRITPDSVGPLAADRVFATRHIKRLANENLSGTLGESAVLAAGVMAQTGMESFELAAAVCEKIKPCRLIVCDSLACSEPAHMGHTIQLCSTGISPGSGVENSRCEISQSTLGIPTAAIGVPTVSRIMSGDKRFKNLLVTPKPIDRLALHAAEMIAGAVNLYIHPTLTLEECASLTL